MRAEEYFRIYLINDSNEQVDITEGLLTVDLRTGIDYYEGPFQQPDTGQFTVVTRNPNLDPKVNDQIKYNARLSFRDLRQQGYLNDNGQFFTGFITDINVDYVPDDFPIITISGIDLTGVLNRILITDEIYEDIILSLDDPEGLTFEEFTQVSTVSDIIASNNFYFFFVKGENQTGGNLGSTVAAYRPARFIPKPGENMLEVIKRYAETNLDFIYLDMTFSEIINNQEFHQVKVFPFAKYNTAYWVPQQDPAIEYPTYQFSYLQADNKGYKNIVVNNGYNRIVNQIEIGNANRTWDPIEEEVNEVSQNFGPFGLTSSINNWGVIKRSLDTFFPLAKSNNTEMERYATDIFQYIGNATPQIETISFDNVLLSYTDFQIGQFYRIKHQLNNNDVIDRFYDIGGIQHSIDRDNWITTFINKPSEQEIAFLYQGQSPVISMNETTGDTNTNFTATITQYPTEDIEEVIWSLNSYVPNDPELFWYAAYTGSLYKNDTPRTGLTQTWNFDDDGILEPPVYGDGVWWAQCWITKTNGWVILGQSPMLTVGEAVPHANFSWQQDLVTDYRKVTFTNTSFNNEEGDPDSYYWEFGDGTESYEKNPIHIYDVQPGVHTYSVSLTVKNYLGTTDTYTTNVTLTEPTMSPSFTYTQNYQSFQFTNTSTNVGFEEPDAYLWDFGDGIVSYEKNPSHIFPADPDTQIQYTVTLTTRNAWETTASTSQTVTINALNESGNLPIRYIQLRATSTPTASDYFPLMYFLKARTSYTLENISFRSRVVNFDPPLGTLAWKEADDSVLDGDNVDGNLRRDPAITTPSAYGVRPRAIVPNQPYSWKITIDLFNPNQTYPQTTTQFMENIVMSFRNYSSQASYPNVEVYKTDYVGDDMSNPNNYTWDNIGYFQLPGGNVGDQERTMTAIYDLPISDPPSPLAPNPFFTYAVGDDGAYRYNKYTFTTSSANTYSYLWDFGDGNTSTLQNPTHIYTSDGNKTVSLTKTDILNNPYTHTEVINVQRQFILVNEFPVRYVKFVQNQHNGSHAYDTPYINSFQAVYQGNVINQLGLMTNTTEQFSVDFNRGTGETVCCGGNFVTFDPNTGTTADRQRLTSTGGLRVKSLDASNRTGWTTIVDFGTPITNISQFKMNAARFSVVGYPATSATGPTYSLYITYDTSNGMNPNTATWIPAGTIQPTALLDSTLKVFYSN